MADAIRSYAQDLANQPYDSGMNVGDIKFDVNKDDPHFDICNSDEIFQYYSLSFSSTDDVKKQVRAKALSKSVTGVPSGYFTIRFVVNCKGEADRFRFYAVDLQYRERSIDGNIAKLLGSIIEAIEAWPIGTFEQAPVDYYRFVTFKIQDSKVMEILP